MITVLGSCAVEPGSDIQWVFVEVSALGRTKKHTVVAPSVLAGAALQTYLDTREEEYVLDLLSDWLPTIPRFDTIADYLQWDADGRIDLFTGEVAETVNVDSKHPSSIQFIPIINAATSIDDIKPILRKIVRALL